VSIDIVAIYLPFGINSYAASNPPDTSITSLPFRETVVVDDRDLHPSFGLSFARTVLLPSLVVVVVKISDNTSVGGRAGWDPRVSVLPEEAEEPDSEKRGAKRG
jgi:hypothetical protein